MKTKENLGRKRLDRRRLLKATAGSALFAALPKALIHVAHASEAPEVANVRIGLIAVQSGASIVIAHEKGFFKKHGLNSTIAKETSWAAARDKLVSGENHGSHLKYAQTLAATLGALGSTPTPMVAPFTLSRNGSVFMVAKKLQGQLTFDPRTWKTVSDKVRASGSPFTIALPHPAGWHGLMYRHFLANGGINADKDLKLITLPPAQMVQNLKVGTMHACAMVEPWGMRGVSTNTTVVTMYGHEMWPNHPTKTFAMMESFVNKNPKTARAMLRALHEASVWCDDVNNRPELARILSTPSYMNAPQADILRPLLGQFDWGDGRKLTDPSKTIRYGLDNYPQPREAKWFISQFRRWGMITGEPDYDAIATRVLRADIYTQAMEELGVKPQTQNDAPIKFWDGTTFDHKQAAAFARSARISNPKD
jgi:nitrate/nitrite transport system substrate-binding protein